jgi:hypothetical protein
MATEILDPILLLPELGAVALAVFVPPGRFVVEPAAQFGARGHFDGDGADPRQIGLFESRAFPPEASET